MHSHPSKIVLLLAACLIPVPLLRAAETCTTQSALKAADRTALVTASDTLAFAIQANDAGVVRGSSIPELQAEFAPVSSLVASTAPALRGGSPQIEDLYLLDASSLGKTPTGANPDVQFFCTLNQSQNEADFNIPQLPPGRYAFVMVGFNTPNPVRLSLLLREEGAAWRLAGLYPKPLTAEGHDGLWFWTQSRKLQSGSTKEPWTAWLYLQEALQLLQPAPFVSSTHLEKLTAELNAAIPQAITGGLSNDTPLVLKFIPARGAPPAEFRVTALAVDDSLGPDKLDVTEHIKVDSLADASAARQRNLDAASALLSAHPELRKSFHGVWVFAEAPGAAAPYGTELAMTDIPVP